MLQFNDDLPFTTLQSVILTTGPLVFVWSYFRRYSDQHGGFKWAEMLLDSHDFLIATVSLILAAYALDIGHNILDAQTGITVDPHMIGYAYHILKLYEYLDVILMVLAGQKVGKYSAFRHLMLPFLSWYRIIGRPHDSLDWRLHIILDCSVRFLSRALPWLVEDVNTEEAIISTCEEGRWYGELIINAFWFIFIMQGTREGEQALQIFGKPYKEEGTARLLSVGLCAYAVFSKRQEDATTPAKKNAEKRSPLREALTAQAKRDALQSTAAQSRSEEIRGVRLRR